MALDISQSSECSSVGGNNVNSFSITLSAAQFTDSLAKAKQAGIALNGDAGSLPVASGVHARYSIAPAAVDGSRAVTITVDQKPWLVTIGVIERKIRGMLGV